MLKISNFTKAYNKSDKLAVDNINLELKPGEIFGFLGPNGAGKSTTIKCLTGILDFSDGEILIDGIDIKTNPVSAKINIGYVPDNHETFEKLTGMEYVNFLADLFGVSKQDREERCQKYLKKFNLEDAFKKQIKTYSHGMKQKITVIGALIHNPKLWVLDEPMMGLDPASSFELKQAMREHANEGNTVFFSSHVLEVVEKLCDRIAIIDDGKIVAVGTVDELKGSNASLESYFLKLTGGDNLD